MCVEYMHFIPPVTAYLQNISKTTVPNNICLRAAMTYFLSNCLAMGSWYFHSYCKL